jgi:NAD(P)-dependent dehydrogenase (short-subunit alcohol dehydrogenase family)
MEASELFDVRALSVMVTGAASGIGLGYAEVMAANGASVTLVDVDPDGLQREVARLRAKGADVAGEVADVTKPETVHAAVAATLARKGRVDVLFANAGVSAGPAS